MSDATKDVDLIQKYSNILLKHDPYNEKLYYEIMDIYAVNGNYNMAIKLYYDLEKVLADELGVEPSPKIKELFHRIFNVKGNTKAESSGWNAPFLGRTSEIYQVSECIVGTRKEPPSPMRGHQRGGWSRQIRASGQGKADGAGIYAIEYLCMLPAIREESEFFLRPWNDIFWEIEQCVENGLLERSITEEEQAQLDRFFKGSILGDEKPLGRLTYQLMEKAILGYVPQNSGKAQGSVVF